MKKKAVIVGIFCCTIFSLTAQQFTIAETVAQRFELISNTLPQEKVYLHTDKYFYSAGESIFLKAYLVNAATHQPTTRSNFIYVELIDSAQQVKHRLKIRREGTNAPATLKFPQTLKAGEYTLRAYTSWMQNAGPDFFFHKKINLGSPTETSQQKTEFQPMEQPVKKDSFDIQFFPESGHFFTGESQLIAYKAIGTDGLAVDVNGSVYNQHQEEVTLFNSAHRGMGKLAVRANPGDRFYAIVKNNAGVEKKVDLPEPATVGIGLHMWYNNDRIKLKMLNRTHLPVDSLRLMIHSRGRLIVMTGLSGYEAQLSEEYLPEGIASFSIIDNSGAVWCERLFFIRNFQPALISHRSDREEYQRREAVELTFRILNPDSSAMKGSFSASITDSYYVKEDATNDNILSYLLLSSDLKGYVESPQEYFTDNTLRTREKTDLLMLTQGWKRFNTAEVASARFPEIKYFMEAGQSLSGKVLNLFNKPVIGNKVAMLSPYKNQVRTTLTDSLGRYYFDAIEFPDSTKIIVKAMSRIKLVDVEILPDEEEFPQVKPYMPDWFFRTDTLRKEYIQISREKMYEEGELMVVDLDEVTVKASRKASSPVSTYSQMADNRLDGERLEQFKNMRLLDVLGTIPGVYVTGNNITVRGGSGSPLFVVDGFRTETFEEVSYLFVSDLEEILVFKGASANIFGPDASNGVISFTLKQGHLNRRMTPPSLVTITPLGFHEPTEFYNPRYDVDSLLTSPTRDLRTTLYWNPHVVPDSTGQVTLRFYTADNPNNYRIELEGMGDNGIIGRYTGIIRRK